MTNLLQGLQQEMTVKNTKGGNYYSSTYDSNLDFFASCTRRETEEKIMQRFAEAYAEDKNIALANLLYVLDIRGGKGERKMFKACFKYLCSHENTAEDALKIIPFISELGRWDYLLVGLHTYVEYEVINVISRQLHEDLQSDNPSLLAKWLPSVRTHGKNNPEAAYLARALGMTEKEYRKLLSNLRNKIKLIETQLTEKDYDAVDFEKVPTKAMLKYRDAFQNKMGDKYKAYINSVETGEKKINTTGLFCYEIINKILGGRDLAWFPELNESEERLFDLMWKNQKDFLEGNDKNVLVMADTSGSMTCWNNGLPLSNSIGLALYIAERNHGFFHNYFMTFDSEPALQKVSGSTIVEKVRGLKEINVGSTNIDKAFDTLLHTAVKNAVPNKEMPSHIIVISDMEFDEGVRSQNGTNFQGWKEQFEECGYKLPIIIFWNVAGTTGGFPATKNDKDVAMISGFSTSVLSSILDLDNYNPVDAMMGILKPYLDMLEGTE